VSLILLSKSSDMLSLLMGSEFLELERECEERLPLCALILGFPSEVGLLGPPDSELTRSIVGRGCLKEPTTAWPAFIFCFSASNSIIGGLLLGSIWAAAASRLSPSLDNCLGGYLIRDFKRANLSNRVMSIPSSRMNKLLLRCSDLYYSRIVLKYSLIISLLILEK